MQLLLRGGTQCMQNKQKCRKFIMVFKYNALRELLALTLQVKDIDRDYSS